MSNLFNNLDRNELRSAVIGMVLGDLNLQIHGTNARAQASHTPRVRDYVNLKGTILRQIPDLKCSITDRIQKNKKLGKEYPIIILRTSTNLFLTELEQRMYRPIKQVDAELLDELTPLGLALWYMDDGHLELHHNVCRFQPDRNRTRQERSIGARNIKLNTQSFSRQENDLICSWLKSRWAIKARLKIEKNQSLIYEYDSGSQFCGHCTPFCS